MENPDRTHVDEGALLALLDGELSTEETVSLNAHLSNCSVCAERRDELRDVTDHVSMGLASLASPSPFVEMPDALRRVARAAATPIASAPSWVERVSRGGRRSLAMAAGLTLVLAAAAYALPGSPIRGWVNDSVAAIGNLVGLGDAGPSDPGPAVVSVQPVDQRVTVRVRGATPDLRVSITLASGPSASASAREARFRVESGVIEVQDASGLLEIELPSSVEAASVEIDGTIVAEVRDRELVRTIGADSSPAEILVETRG